MTADVSREHAWNSLVLREFLDHFYHGSVGLRELCNGYQRGEEIRFIFLDTLVREHLFPLKEVSHRLFRVVEEVVDGSDDTVEAGTILDLTLGVLFHEVLELKEQVYLLAIYRPRLHRLRERGGSMAEELYDLDALVKNAAHRLPKTVLAISNLLETSQTMLHRLLPAWRNLRMVVLFFHTHDSLLCEVYGKQGAQAAFGLMFDGVEAMGWLVSGRFLWEAGHLEQALDAFEAARGRLPSDALRQPAAAECLREIETHCQKLVHGHHSQTNDTLREKARALLVRAKDAVRKES